MQETPRQRWYNLLSLARKWFRLALSSSSLCLANIFNIQIPYLILITVIITISLPFIECITMDKRSVEIDQKKMALE